MPCLFFLSATILLAFPAAARNLVLFVADGLRPGMISAGLTPAMASLRGRGVWFANTHSLFPTFTTANASGMATGHALGDTGDYSNDIDVGFPVPGAGGSLTPFLESDPVLGDVDEHFAGNYLNEVTILRAARGAGFSTASIGKLGPALIFDHTARDGQSTVVVDDMTGRRGGVPLAAGALAALKAAGLPAVAPSRGDNAEPGTHVANGVQQDFFVSVATEAVLPMFARAGKPFVLVFWSRDPDGTQHNQGDSPGRLVPGINGPTSRAAIANADRDLARLMDVLHLLRLDGDTDVMLASDHGFSTIDKESAASWAATRRYAGVTAGLLPVGFLAIDLAHGLGMTLFDPDHGNAVVTADHAPLHGNGLIGANAAHPAVVVAANGGSDLVYLPGHDRALARRVAALLSGEDYVSGLFVDDALGPLPGTLSLRDVALQGSAVTPQPAIAVSFRSFATGCGEPTMCGAELADTALTQGEGMHGSFSRADTRSVLAAVGPDFQARFVDPAPVSNADVGMTIVHLLHLTLPAHGTLVGRVLGEALVGGKAVAWQASVLRSPPDALGHVTELHEQRVGNTRYFDAAGYPGRTLGVP